MRKESIATRIGQRLPLLRLGTPLVSLAPVLLGLGSGLHEPGLMAGLALLGGGLGALWQLRWSTAPLALAPDPTPARSEQLHRVVAAQLLESMQQQQQALARAVDMLRIDTMEPDMGALLQSCHTNQSAQATERSVQALSQTLERVAMDMRKSTPAQSLAWAMDALVDCLVETDTQLPERTLGLLRHAQLITGQLRDLLETHNRLLEQACRVAKQSLMQACETSHASRRLNSSLKSSQGDELCRHGMQRQLDQLLQEMQRNSALQVEIMQSTNGLLERHAPAPSPAHPAALP